MAAQRAGVGRTVPLQVQKQAALGADIRTGTRGPLRRHDPALGDRGGHSCAAASVQTQKAGIQSGGDPGGRTGEAVRDPGGDGCPLPDPEDGAPEGTGKRGADEKSARRIRRIRRMEAMRKCPADR